MFLIWQIMTHVHDNIDFSILMGLWINLRLNSDCFRSASIDEEVNFKIETGLVFDKKFFFF